MDELLDQFLIEARELVQLASADLLALEQAPADAARIDGAFRAIHTLKGSVGLFDFAPLEAMLRAAEDLMGALRARRLAADATVIDALLGCLGATEAWVEAIAATGALPAAAAAQSERLAAALRAPLADPDAPPPVPAAPATIRPSAPDWLPALLARHAAAAAMAGPTPAGGAGLTAVRYTPARDCFFRGDDPMAVARAIPELIALDISGGAAVALDAFDPFACTLVIEALSAAPADAVRAVFRLVADQVEIVPAGPPPDAARQDGGPGGHEPAAAARTLRIDAARIDAMADIVGELIVAKNRLAHLAGEAASGAPGLVRALAANQAEFDRLVGDLHRALQRVRMVPLEQTTRRLPRLVREIAGRLGKPVQFEIGGAESEADKTIVDGLFEPLLHVLRNAIDHGIEDAQARRAAGKPPSGRILLQAGRAGGDIVITVADDGAGIDPAALRRAARARGVLGAAAIDALDDAGALDLVFAPGFSTAAAVTDVSGRGVGLDAVRSALHGMGGQVGIASVPGQGTTVRLRVPQAVAVTTLLLVEAGGERFGVPIEAVAQSVRVPARRILPIRDGLAFVLQDRTIPLLRLAALLGLDPGPLPGTDARVLVVGAGDRCTGLLVDGFGGRLDVVLRPLGGMLAGMRGLLGAALQGDGRVLLVLDMAALLP